MARVVKPAKLPTWTKDITLEYWPGRDVRKLEIAESLILEDRILEDGITLGDMTGRFHRIIRIGSNLRAEDNTCKSVRCQDHSMDAL